MGQAYTTAKWFSFGKRYFNLTGYENAAKNFTLDLSTADLRGKSYVVTGANSGLGKETAQFLAQQGGRVFMVCRSEARGKAARDEMLAALASESKDAESSSTSTASSAQDAALADRLVLVIADVGVRADVAKIRDVIFSACEGEGLSTGTEASAPKLEAIVCNAGCLADSCKFTADGFEETFAVHLLFGSYALVEQMKPLLKGGSPAQAGRAIFVTSGGMYLTNLGWKHLAIQAQDGPPARFDGTMAYSRAKRGQVMLAEGLAARDTSSGISYVSVHPGWASTPGVDRSLPKLKSWLEPMRSASQGADSVRWLAVARKEELSNGALYLDRTVQPKHLPTMWAPRKDSDEVRDVMMDDLARLSTLAAQL